MIFEQVNFNEEAVRKMKKEDFEERHLNLFWQDRSEDVRRKMLEQVYTLCYKPAQKKNKE